MNFFTQFLGVIVSIPYSNVIFDTKFVQNWQGFWFSLITNSIFQFCFTSITTHQVEFSVVHREVSNNIYALSVYYISQIVISVCVDIFFVFNIYHGINNDKRLLFTVHLDGFRVVDLHIFGVLDRWYQMGAVVGNDVCDTYVG